MKTLKYIIIVLLVLAIAFCIGQVRQNGFSKTVHSVTAWFNGLTSNDVDATESTDPVETTVPETVPEENQPEEQPEAPEFYENSDKTVSMCAYEFLKWAQKNEMYDETTNCGPINVPHADEETFSVWFTPEEALGHDHTGEKVNMMISLGNISVFCCNEEKADHDNGLWNLGTMFAIGFKNTRVEICNNCKGLANGDMVLGEVMELELTEEDWQEIEKVACYWWEKDETTGENVRVFGMKQCICENPTTGTPTTPSNPTKPSNPSNPSNPGDDKDPTNPTQPSNPTEPSNPTDPTEPSKPDHNPDPTPSEPDTAPDEHPVIDNGDPTDEPVIDNGEPDGLPAIDNGEPPIENVPEEQPDVSVPDHNPDPVPMNIPEEQPEAQEIPVIDNGEPPVNEEESTPVIDNGEPTEENVPEEQPMISEPSDSSETSHNEDPTPVEIPEAQPEVQVEPVIDNGEPPVFEEPTTPVIDNGEPPM